MENIKTKATRKKQNPYLAISEDGLNEAYGATKEEAIENLKKGMLARENQK